MRISIFGMGYVGVVSAACFAKLGHTVVGVDVNPDKVDLINSGKSPIVEAQLDNLLHDSVRFGRIRATQDHVQAVAETDISLVCVGTPSQANGKLNIGAVEAVCRQIGAAIAQKKARHTVVIRSTILPGAMKAAVLPILEQETGGKAGAAFGLAHNPEFLREGVAVSDFFSPPKTVIGAIDDEGARRTAELYERIDAPLMITRVEVSEMVKYVDNVWHALKVSFGNEIGNICKAQDIDSHAVMDIFCADTKLNISPAYLKPGFAFGGSCLPKDTRALLHRAKELDVAVPVISGIMESNRLQIERAIRLIMSLGRRRISVLGFSFKAGTDDLRESPLVELIERLIGKGYDLKLYDSNVSLAALTGANKSYILDVIPHISSLLVESIDEALAHGEVIVVGNRAPEFTAVPPKIQSHQHLFDFVRLENVAHLGDRYEGINWAHPAEAGRLSPARLDDRREPAGAV
jgi:GDP-mannose 6-dehydrogenase